ncbi:putative HD superfamily hydrolase domain protein [Escherichia coli 2788150]|nr:putative HD superfamily hydrolase domain protein [Escherichia coli 2788150]
MAAESLDLNMAKLISSHDHIAPVSAGYVSAPGRKKPV